MADEWIPVDDEWTPVDEEPGKGLLGGPNATISAAEPESWYKSAWRSLFDDSNNDVYKNDKGDYVQDVYMGPEEGIKTIPEFESQAGRRRTAQGMSFIASMAPGMALAKAPAAATLLGRVLKNYLPAAAASSATGIAFDKASQVNGDIPVSTLEDDAERFKDETAFGTALPGALDAGLTGLQKTGAFLKDKLSTKVIPEQVIPEVKAQYSDWTAPPSFDETMTAAQRAKAMKTNRTIDPNTGKVVSSLEKAVEGNRALVDAAPEESLSGILAAKEGALNKADSLVANAENSRVPLPSTQEKVTRVIPGKQSSLVDEAGNPITHPDQVIEEMVTIPPQYQLNTTKAEEFVAGIKDPIDRAKAAEYLAEKKAAFESQWDGDLNTLHEFRRELTTSNPKSYEKGLGDVTPDQARINKALASDLNNMLDDAANGYKATNAKASEMLRLEPTAVKRAAKARTIQEKNMTGAPKEMVIQKGETIPEQRVPGAWQNKVDSAAKILGPLVGAGVGAMKGGGWGAAGGAALGNTIGQMGGISEAVGRLSGALGRGAGGAKGVLPLVPGVAAQMAPQGFGPDMVASAQAEQLLPRDTDRFTSDALEAFLMKTAPTPQGFLAQQLVAKLQKAFQAEDMDTIEKLHSDMTRLFPDLFEPGVGVNGKVFYPDEQMKVMDNLKQLNRMGVVDSIHLAKQRNAFNNPQDSRILPVKKASSPGHDGKPRFHEGTRVYDY